MIVVDTARRRLEEFRHREGVESPAVLESTWILPAPERVVVRLPSGSLTGRASQGTVVLTHRQLGSFALVSVGAVFYNWWVAAAFDHHLMASPDQLFSDLETQGLPHSVLFQRVDLVSGLVLLAALVLRGPMARGLRRSEWPWLVVFALAAALGGHFAYACPEGRSASCRSAEWHLELPMHHYLHVASGIIEFGAVTVAVLLACRRTAGTGTTTAVWVRWIGVILLVAYPVLAVSYLGHLDGAFVEPVFFLTFTAMVAVEVLEPIETEQQPHRPTLT